MRRGSQPPSPHGPVDDERVGAPHLSGLHRLQEAEGGGLAFGVVLEQLGETAHDVRVVAEVGGSSSQDSLAALVVETLTRERFV